MAEFEEKYQIKESESNSIRQSIDGRRLFISLNNQIIGVDE